jgi:hypothetical protein
VKRRKLRLNRETIGHLATADLRAVRGGAVPTANQGNDCIPTQDYTCVTCDRRTSCRGCTFDFE